MNQGIFSRHIILLRKEFPFFATLALFAEFRFDENIPFFGNRNKQVLFNPKYFLSLSHQGQQALMSHELLHLALLHKQRRGTRDGILWNHASDIVVNNILIESNVCPPERTAVDRSLKKFSVEQVYEILLKQQSFVFDHDCVINDESDLLSQLLSFDYSSSDTSSQGCSEQKTPNALSFELDMLDDDDNPNASYQFHMNTNHWKAAIAKAEISEQLRLQRSKGTIPAGLQIELRTIANPELDWRTILWEFIVKTPDDYQGYDRRFIHQGLYLEQLETTEKLNVVVAIDTSASISEPELAQFIAELDAILNTYHFINVVIFTLDTEVYGPFSMAQWKEQPTPVGGGGTDFRDFFNLIEQTDQVDEPELIVFFTDGEGDFPTYKPSIETLWVVVSGGLSSSQFPFGQIARLANHHAWQINA